MYPEFYRTNHTNLLLIYKFNSYSKQENDHLLFTKILLYNILK